MEAVKNKSKTLKMTLFKKKMWREAKNTVSKKNKKTPLLVSLAWNGFPKWNKLKIYLFY